MRPELYYDVTPCRLVNNNRHSEKRSASVFMTKESKVISEGLTCLPPLHVSKDGNYSKDGLSCFRPCAFIIRLNI